MWPEAAPTSGLYAVAAVPDRPATDVSGCGKEGNEGLHASARPFEADAGAGDRPAGRDGCDTRRIEPHGAALGRTRSRSRFLRGGDGRRLRRLVCGDGAIPTATRPAHPHTAIVPRNKDRIGDALGRFIVENFLSPRVLDAKLRQLELTAWGGAWLQEPRNAAALADRLVTWGPDLVRAMPSGTLEALAGSTAMAAARSTPAAPTASALLAAVWNEGRVQPLVERGAGLLSDYLAQHQEVVFEKVQGQSWRWLPSWVDRAIARRIAKGLLQLLADVRAPDHPWRRKLAEG